MAKLNWFLSLKNMAKSDETAKQLLESINSAESEELKEKAKLEAREYIESFADSEPEKPAEPEPIVEPEHIEVESKVEQAKQELEVDLDTPEDTGERPELQPPVNADLVARIARRQKLAEENARKRRNQPVTLSERRAWAEEKAREIDARNAMMAKMRTEIREQVAKTQELARQNNERNMIGLKVTLLRELKLRKRLELICRDHHISRADLEKLKQVNPNGWQECLAERPKLEIEMDMYIK
jgi:type IV secretory pathway VirB10-like protein